MKKDLGRRLRFIDDSEAGVDAFIARTLLIVVSHKGHRAQIRKAKMGFPHVPFRCPICRTKVEDVIDLDYRFAQEK